MMQDVRSNHVIRLSDLNAHVTCNICNGYLIDAVSITECLHPCNCPVFCLNCLVCKSCIVNYLTANNTCPVCGILIHQSHPLNYISADRTLQDIVYKIVPNLKDSRFPVRFKMKEKQERSFIDRLDGSRLPMKVSCFVYHLVGECAKTLEQSKDRTPDKSSHSPSYQQDPYYHRLDEQVHIQLEPGSDCLEPLRLKFLRLSSKATVTHLRKYVAHHVLHDISKFHDIDIFILNNENGTFLGRDHALKFVRVVYWNEVSALLPDMFIPLLAIQ
uniref:RING-type domain-containing protein n=1 Tax=Schistocephalus solidus TaxID=70667 RepID=A0A183SU26_SCHSO